MSRRYKKPKSRLHREFVYLNHDSVLNSLSAFEAGKVDEIIRRTTEDTEAGLEASAARVKGGKKRRLGIQEELVVTRTRFSAFDAWHAYLTKKKAIGKFGEWSVDVRGDLEVGDTIQFDATIDMSPLHKVMTTFVAFVSNPSSPGLSELDGNKRKEMVRTAKMIDGWLTTADGHRNLSVYFQPGGVAYPRILGRLDQSYLVGGLDAVAGGYTVVGQVAALLAQGEVDTVMRIIRDAPPTPIEHATIRDAFLHFVDPSSSLGVEIREDDLEFTYPTVVLRPIAIFR